VRPGAIADLAGVLARHPRHLALAAVVAGLLLGPVTVAGAALAGALLGALTTRPGPAMAVAVLAVAAAITAEARLAAVEGTVLAADGPRTVDLRATLLEPIRTHAPGRATAIVGVAGTRVLLRLPRGGPGAPSVNGRVSAAGGRAARPGVGEILRVTGRLGPPDRHAELVHASATLRAATVSATGARRTGVEGSIDAIRRRAQRALAGSLRPAEAGLLRGMVLGDDTEIPDPVREAMRDAGLSHLVAASGQNVLLLTTMVLLLGALVGAPWTARLVGALVLVALYVPLAGAGPSIQRAGIMGAAGLLAALAGRPASRWYALLLAAAVTLALDPRACGDAGWQLSFAAVGGILVLGPHIASGLADRGGPRPLAEACAITASATLATAPLLALLFGETSLVSLPANVLATPLVAPIMWIGAVAAAVGQISPGTGEGLAQLAAVPLALLVALARSAAAVPGATITPPPLAVLGVVAVIAFAVLVPSARRPVPWLVVAITAGALALAPAPQARLAPPTGLRIAALDVGQGDAILVQHGRSAVLVDTGSAGSGVVGELRRLGVSRLDVLVGTHAQEDHIGAMPEVLAALPVGLVLDGRDGVRTDGDALIDAAIAARGARRIVPDAGQVLRAGPVELRVLSPSHRPDGPSVTGEDPNDRSIVLDVRAQGIRALLTGDAESPVLLALPLEEMDVLKVSHHGSADDGLTALLARIRPRVALVSAGRRNPFGHPTPGTLAALAAAVPRVARTDTEGTVVVEPRAGGDLAVEGID
jgi:competence protein ComEC